MTQKKSTKQPQSVSKPAQKAPKKPEFPKGRFVNESNTGDINMGANSKTKK